MRLEQIKSSDSNFKLSREIRSFVFVEEQGVSISDEHDGFDDIANHYLVFKNNVSIATARSRNTSFGIKLERFAVLIEYRNQGVGSFLVKQILKNLSSSHQLIYLHAQKHVLEFYISLGFEKVGEVFQEAGIEHFKMVFRA